MQFKYLQPMGLSVFFLITVSCSHTTLQAPPLKLDKDGRIYGDSAGSTMPQIKYSFRTPPYIRPGIIRMLVCPLGDSHASITEVDIEAAMKSSQFDSDTYVRKYNDMEFIGCRKNSEYFEYRYISTTPSGIHILECFDCGGGSGIFTSLLLISFSSSCEFSDDREFKAIRRSTLKRLAEIGLGDRYDGIVSYSCGILRIGPQRAPYPPDAAINKEIILRLE